MKILLTFLICSMSLLSFSQEKNDITKSQNDLVEVRASIAKVDTKIAVVKSRVDLTVESPTSVSANNTIAELKKERVRLQKIETSILSHLGMNTPTSEKTIILKADFDKLPIQNQEQILAHPERYQVKN